VGQLLLEAKELDFGPCSDYFVESVAEFGAQYDTKLSFADGAICVVAPSKASGRVLTFDMEFHKVAGLQPFPAP
jgi:hypothetical protein